MGCDASKEVTAVSTDKIDTRPDLLDGAGEIRDYLIEKGLNVSKETVYYLVRSKKLAGVGHFGSNLVGSKRKIDAQFDEITE
jgi:hypothetical protein